MRVANPTSTRWRVPLLAIVVVLACAPIARPAPGEDAAAREVERLAKVLDLQRGSTVAEIGAGQGEMTIAMARVVGETGRVYSTELGDEKVEQLRDAVGRAGVAGVTILDASETGTNLPTACCDAIFLRRVYHHLTRPDLLDASLLASLRPGGRLAVLDFEPRGGVRPPGVPANRKGHGVPVDVVVQELAGAGFEHLRTEDWTDGMYLALFRKPEVQRRPADAAGRGGR